MSRGGRRAARAEARDPRRSAVAVGVFDGVHRGHVAILEQALASARDRSGRCVVVGFDPHPDLVLAKRFRPLEPLTPLPERRAMLLALGVDEFEVLPFTRELAALGPEEFVDRHLVVPFAPHTLVVGADFALGRGRSGDVSRLAAIGREREFRVEAVSLLEVDGAPVTSTRIRRLLSEGRVAEAARLLGRRHGFGGTVVPGDRIGRTLGVPTANLRLHEERLIPGDGIYAVWVRINGESTWRPGAMSIGVRPTIGGQVRTLEVHLLGWRGELEGWNLEVEFAEWLRPELAFESRDALAAAMQADLAEAGRRLARGREPAGSVCRGARRSSRLPAPGAPVKPSS